MDTPRLMDWVLYFYLYCFLGWVWETTIISIRKRKFVNRGFLKGPLLPIYGFGAILILLVTKPLRDHYLLMALAGMAAATLLEYVTGAVMEKLFGVRYWDYSNNFLNINGYVCLSSTLCWGALTLFVVYGIHRPIAGIVNRIPDGAVFVADLLLTVCAAADFATSFKAAIDFRDVLIEAERLKEEGKALQARMEELNQQLKERAERKKDEVFARAAGAKEAAAESLERTKETHRLQEEHLELEKRRAVYEERRKAIYSKSIHGLLRRNPGAVSHAHPEGMKEVREAIRRHSRENFKH